MVPEANLQSFSLLDCSESSRLGVYVTPNPIYPGGVHRCRDHQFETDRLLEGLANFEQR